MQRNVVTKSFLRDRSFVVIAKLSATWLLGLMLGAYIGLFSFDSLRPWIFAVCMKSVTFFSAALALLLPLLFTVCLVYLLPSDAVLIAAFLKAASFAFVAVSCVLCFESAGWLLARLLLLSDFLSVPVLIWVWYRILCGRFCKRDVLFSFVFLLVIGVVDHCIAVPLLSSLF